MNRKSKILAAATTLSGRASFLTASLLPALATALCAAEPITLDALVAETLAHNPELNFYEAAIAVARGERRAAGQWANPTLSSELGSKNVEDLAGNKTADGPIWAVSVAQTFEFPGRVSLRKAIASKQIDLAGLGLEQFRAALAARVRSLGYTLLAAEEKATAAREVAGRFHDLLDVLVQREPSGVAPLLERRIIEANALTLDRRLIEAERARQAAGFELNQLRGVAIAAPVAILRTELPLKIAPELPLVLAAARERNFEVRTRISEIEQQGFRVKLAENERWPSVTVTPGLRQERADTKELYPSIGVSLPLPVLNQNRGNIAAAKARQLQAEVSLNVKLREVERKVAEARYAYSVQLEAMLRWPRDTLKNLRDAAQQGDQHYRLGALPIATYTALQQQYLEAVAAILDTQADALESRQQLELLTGLNLGDAPPPPKTDDAKPPVSKPATPKRARK